MVLSSIFGYDNYVLVLSIIIFVCLIIFFVIFDKSNFSSYDIVCVSLLTAIAVLGRLAFYYVPQFKPIVAIVIICGVGFGIRSGFICGTLSMLISNFMFGQGAWTLWQMFALGTVGIISGLIGKTRFSNSTVLLCVWGFVAGILYSIIVDIHTLLYFGSALNLSLAIATILSGVVFGLILSVSTVIFIAVLSRPILFAVKRVKVKYGNNNQTTLDINDYPDQV